MSIPEILGAETAATLGAPDYLVGVGASAGGLKAFQALLEGLPRRGDVAWLLLQHLDPAHTSVLAHLLEKSSPLPVLEMREGMPLQGGRVYVCPAGKQCRVAGTALVLEDLPAEGPRHTIDTLLTSIAGQWQDRSAAIILSGTGNDGVRGVQEIKAAGGCALAQDPATAEHGGMPRAVIDLLLPDLVRPPRLLGEELERLLGAAGGEQHPLPDQEPEKFQLLLELLEHETGFNLRRYKEGMLARRLNRRLAANRLTSLAEYLQLVRTSPAESQRLIQDLFITVTGFFRDEAVFRKLEKILRGIVEGKREEKEIRIWSVGCASGEEPYSLALLLADMLDELGEQFEVKIFATDISPANIRRARQGIYPSAAVQHLPEALLRAHFEKNGEDWQVSSRLREMVVFAEHDILSDAPFSRLDLLCCRNLLIYFNRETQEALLERFHYALAPGGILLLGNSENIGKTDKLFRAIDAQARLYQRLEAPASPGLPTLAASRKAASPAAVAPGLSLQQQMRELFFAEYAPPAALVNKRFELLHLHGPVQAYIRLPEGDVSLDLPSLALPELRSDLRQLLLQAQRGGKAVKSRPVRLDRFDPPRTMNMSALPGGDGTFQQGPGEILVLFESRPAIPTGAAASGSEGERVQSLEQELSAARDLLRVNLEALEASGQELQSLNEEYQSTTEELQVSNEEFQTANEELQSANEELLSVNEELQSRSLELLQTNAELDLILNATLAGIIVLDAHLQVKRHSASCQQLFGLWPGEVSSVPQLLSRLLAVPSVAARLEEALGSGKTLQFEQNLSDRYFIIRLIPVSDEDAGAPSSLVIAFHDETERKRKELESQFNENRLNALVESTPDPIIIVEAGGTIQRLNRQVETLFGYSREELLGKSYKVLIPDRFRDQHDVYHRQYQAKPVMRQMGTGLELWCKVKSGEEIPVEIGLSPVVVNDEITTLVRFRDIRQQKREQEILNAARQRADEANRTKSRFLAAASHDLRQPLQSISMYLGALAGRLSAKERARVVDQAKMALDSTNKLLNSLLNITKLESGKVQPEIRPFKIIDLLERVHNTEAQQAREKFHTFSRVPSSAVVASDPALLEQLVTNLVANAIRYTPPEGHILLGCRRLPGFLKIQVCDNGPGIASHELDVIFDEYRQLEYSGHYLGKGLGLGLSIVKLIAELMNLKLEVKSVPGKGSSFSVLVPLSREATRPAATRKASKPKAGKLSGDILLIEDDPAVMDSTSLFLGLAGFKVRTAGNSEEALAQVRAGRPDLIITDYGLGREENGIQLVASLRRELGRQVPAIIITGDTSDSRAHEAAGQDCAIVCKPIEAQTLLQAIQKQLAAAKPGTSGA